MTPAVAYYRTSSSTNVGEDKDSLRRQREAVERWAERNGYDITAEFHDVVSGTDAVDCRPGFSSLLEADPTTILVENASRFARDLMVQMTGHELLKERGIDLIPVDSPTYFTEDTPTARMIRAILGAVAEFEKMQLVHRLKVARDRKRAETGRCGGRKPLAELRPEVVERVRELRSRRVPYRYIADDLASQGFLNERGKPYDPRTLQRALL